MNLRIKRRTLRWIGRGLVGAVALCSLTIGLYLIGLRVTPRTVGQRPILYSPEVRAALDYRGRVTDWLTTLDQIDRQVTQLINETSGENNGNLYDQSGRAEGTIDLSTRLAQAVTIQVPPSALTDLQQQVTAASLAYMAASQKMSVLINAPTPENHSAAQAALDAARQALQVVRSSRWFTFSLIQVAA